MTLPGYKFLTVTSIIMNILLAAIICDIRMELYYNGKIITGVADKFIMDTDLPDKLSRIQKRRKMIYSNKKNLDGYGDFGIYWPTKEVLRRLFFYKRRAISENYIKFPRQKKRR